jgi:predicted esterase YcpF (UPF0227 family)
MNILYIHGFGSRFDIQSDKVKALETLGQVYGIDLDYTQPLQKNLQRCASLVEQKSIDLLIGTSMGGYMVSQLAGLTSLPFVAINPAVDPSQLLRKYVGTNLDHHGVEYTLSPETIKDLPYFNTQADGIVLLDTGDQVIPAKDTVQALADHYTVIMFAGGSHRFDHTQDALPVIKDFYYLGSSFKELA